MACQSSTYVFIVYGTNVCQTSSSFSLYQQGNLDHDVLSKCTNVFTLLSLGILDELFRTVHDPENKRDVMEQILKFSKHFENSGAH